MCFVGICELFKLGRGGGSCLKRAKEGLHILDRLHLCQVSGETPEQK